VHVLQTVQQIKARHEHDERIDIVMDNKTEKTLSVLLSFEGEALPDKVM
jgi:hypothetical protein